MVADRLNQRVAWKALLTCVHVYLLMVTDVMSKTTWLRLATGYCCRFICCWSNNRSCKHTVNNTDLVEAEQKHLMGALLSSFLICPQENALGLKLKTPQLYFDLYFGENQRLATLSAFWGILWHSVFAPMHFSTGGLQNHGPFYLILQKTIKINL